MSALPKIVDRIGVRVVLQLNPKCKIKMSTAAKTIMHTRRGYRNEYDLCHARMDCFATVLAYETMELGNRDIYHTVKSYYGLDKLNLRQSRENINNIILNIFAEHFKCNPTTLKCCWMCAELEDAIRYYGNDDLKQVVFTSRFLIASDLGREGVLIVSPDEMAFYNV